MAAMLVLGAAAVSLRLLLQRRRPNEREQAECSDSLFFSEDEQQGHNVEYYAGVAGDLGVEGNWPVTSLHASASDVWGEASKRPYSRSSKELAMPADPSLRLGDHAQRRSVPVAPEEDYWSVDSGEARRRAASIRKVADWDDAPAALGGPDLGPGEGSVVWSSCDEAITLQGPEDASAAQRVDSGAGSNSAGGSAGSASGEGQVVRELSASHGKSGPSCGTASGGSGDVVPSSSSSPATSSLSAGKAAYGGSAPGSSTYKDASELPSGSKVAASAIAMAAPQRVVIVAHAAVATGPKVSLFEAQASDVEATKEPSGREAPSGGSSAAPQTPPSSARVATVSTVAQSSSPSALPPPPSRLAAMSISAVSAGSPESVLRKPDHKPTPLASHSSAPDLLSDFGFGLAAAEALQLAAVQPAEMAPVAAVPEALSALPLMAPSHQPDLSCLQALQQQVEALRLHHLNRQADPLLHQPAASRGQPLFALALPKPQAWPHHQGHAPALAPTTSLTQGPNPRTVAVAQPCAASQVPPAAVGTASGGPAQGKLPATSPVGSSPRIGAAVPPSSQLTAAGAGALQLAGGSSLQSIPARQRPAAPALASSPSPGVLAPGLQDSSVPSLLTWQNSAQSQVSPQALQLQMQQLQARLHQLQSASLAPERASTQMQVGSSPQPQASPQALQLQMLNLQARLQQLQSEHKQQQQLFVQPHNQYHNEQPLQHREGASHGMRHSESALSSHPSLKHHLIQAEDGPVSHHGHKHGPQQQHSDGQHPHHHHHHHHRQHPYQSESARRTQEWVASTLGTPGAAGAPPNPFSQPSSAAPLLSQIGKELTLSVSPQLQPSSPAQSPASGMAASTHVSNSMPPTPASTTPQQFSLPSQSGGHAGQLRQQQPLSPAPSGLYKSQNSVGHSSRRSPAGSRHRSSSRKSHSLKPAPSLPPSPLALFGARLMISSGEKLMPAPRMEGKAFFVPLKHSLRMEMSELISANQSDCSFTEDAESVGSRSRSPGLRAVGRS